MRKNGVSGCARVLSVARPQVVPVGPWVQRVRDRLANPDPPVPSNDQAEAGGDFESLLILDPGWHDAASASQTKAASFGSRSGAVRRWRSRRAAGSVRSKYQAFPYERNENFISQERLFESGGVVAQHAQADDSSPSPSLRTPVAVRSP